jgi:hypothetical protein
MALFSCSAIRASVSLLTPVSKVVPMTATSAREAALRNILLVAESINI